MKLQIEKYLNQQANVFKIQSLETFKRPSSRKVHKLRVNVRRIRAVIWLSEHGSPHLSFKNLSSSLQKLNRSLGELRQLDVASKDAKKYSLKIKNLAHQFRPVRKILHRQLDRTHRKNVLYHIRKAAQKIENKSVLDLTNAISKLEKTFSFWTKKKEIQETELHALRKATKKARYTLEAMGKPIGPLRDLQCRLGRVHDLMILQDLTKKNIELQLNLSSEYQLIKSTIKPALQFAIHQLKEKTL